MKKTRRVVAVGAIAAVVAVFGVGYGDATAQDGPRSDGPRASESSQIQQQHQRMMRAPEMLRMHKQMIRDPEMRRMHREMMGMPGRGSSEMGGQGHMGG